MPNTDDLIKQFIAVRDQRAELAAEYEKQDGVLKLRMEEIEQDLLNICKETGSTGLRTDSGSATRTIKTRYWANDWEAIYKFIREHDALDLLEKRIAQVNMKTFLEAHPDLMPQGLNTDMRYTITVRRK